MYENIEKRENELWDRLDQLEGCEDNPVYVKEIKDIRSGLLKIQEFWSAELF